MCGKKLINPVRNWLFGRGRFTISMSAIIEYWIKSGCKKKKSYYTRLYTCINGCVHRCKGLSRIVWKNCFGKGLKLIKILIFLLRKSWCDKYQGITVSKGFTFWMAQGNNCWTTLAHNTYEISRAKQDFQVISFNLYTFLSSFFLPFFFI